MSLSPSRLRDRVKFFLIVNFFIISSSVFSEEVYMKDGRRLSGRIIGQTGTEIILSGLQGKQNLFKRDISRITYIPFSEEDEKRRLAQERATRNAAMRRLQELENLRIAEEQKAEAEKKAKEQAELEAEIQADKEREAKETAERAAALRELVDQGKMEKPVGEPISYMDFVWRSLLVPGWGHFYLDRPVMGTFYSGGTLLLAANVYNQYSIAKKAMVENHREVKINYYIMLFPELAPREVRVYYSTDSNAKAMIQYKKKIDNFNNSLVLLEAFYGIQVLHTIYNAIAWENGFFVVENDDVAPGQRAAILPDIRIEPILEARGRVTADLKIGLSYLF